MTKQNDNYNLANMLSKAEKEIEKLERELAELATEKNQLLIALHEAINRPKGVVPNEAEEFYEQDFYSTTTARYGRIYYEQSN